MSAFLQAFQGTGLMARVLRSSSWVLIGYGGGQALRLASNLILTRLLFPEAFGLMALVTMVTVGLMMFSDMGISPSIVQSPRGDDPDFLDTAWTLQVLRGLGLWAAAAALGWPMAQIYDAPDLMLFLPLAGVGLLLAGFEPTRIETANRHLLVGRLTVLDLAAQMLGIGAMVVLALLTQSVVALVAGGIFQAAARLVLTQVFLPGHRNRFRWEPAAASEMLHFGKWIFLSTAFWFVISQSDKAILGHFLDLEQLGLYNIGYFLASFPMMLGLTVNHRLMIPIYRDRPAAADPRNRRRQRQLRAGLSLGFGGLVLVMALIGPGLVDLLYDTRYAASGAVVVLVSVSLLPAVVLMTYDQAALAGGDSRGYFVNSAVRALAQVGLMLAGFRLFGLPGAVAALGLAQLASYPVLAWLSRRHHVWDPLHDVAGLVLGGLGGAAVLALHWPRLVHLTAAVF